jgi:hypothetical protein
MITMSKRVNPTPPVPEILPGHRTEGSADCSQRISRRAVLGSAASALAGVALAWVTPVARASVTALQVWKSPTCGCCADWIHHMESSGAFRVTAQDTGNNAVRARLGMPMRLGSCHTALVEGYVIEGHVPVADVQRLLRERPDALGLTVPGMPIGSPGMDGPAYGGRRDPYDVLLVLRDGSSRTFTPYR